MQKFIKKLTIQCVVLAQICSCSAFNNEAIKKDETPKDLATVILKLRSDRLVNIKRGATKNAIALKWCRVGLPRCSEYFYIFHCERTLEVDQCAKIEKTFRKTRGEEILDISPSLFSNSYSFYKIKPGSYYLGNLEELDSLKESSWSFREDPLLEKRKSEMKPIDEKNKVVEIIGLTGLALIMTSIKMLEYLNLEASGLVAAAGTSMIFTSFALDKIMKGDVMYVGNFNSVDGWSKKLNQPKFLSFKVEEGETAYLGDISIHLRARGGIWPSRRDGMIDIFVTDNLQQLLNESPEYDEMKVTKKLAKPEFLIGKYGAGNF